MIRKKKIVLNFIFCFSTNLSLSFSGGISLQASIDWLHSIEPHFRTFVFRSTTKRETRKASLLLPPHGQFYLCVLYSSFHVRLCCNKSVPTGEFFLTNVKRHFSKTSKIILENGPQLSRILKYSESSISVILMSTSKG